MFKYINLSIITMTILAVTGCASKAGNLSNLEEDYGNSVNQMIQAQILDPNAAAFPDEDGPMSYDGDKGVRTLESYRKDLPDARAIEKDYR